MPLRLKPTGNRVLVEPISAKITTRSGILIPVTAVDDPSEGIVVAQGPGKDAVLETKIGDRVFFNRHDGQPIVSNGKKYKMFDHRELLAIIG